MFSSQIRHGYIVLSNVVMTEVNPVSPGSGFTRDRHIEIPVECYMEQYGQSAVSFHPETSKIIYHEEGYGKFSFQMQLYPNSAYVTPYPPHAYPLDVELKERLYFETKVSAQDWLELFIDTCVATQTTNPYTSPRYELIRNG